jgi:murein L,D-transpeptidase YafK
MIVAGARRTNTIKHRPGRYLSGLLAGLLLTLLLPLSAAAFSFAPLQTDRASVILAKVRPHLEQELAAKKLHLGAPVFLRIFKLPGELEVWLEEEGRYRLFKSYSVCSASGFPGPKTREGDWQSPEGFYAVTAEQMNPESSYHLSFDIGYPNEYDRFFNRSGGNIMVHGSCSSTGCFAMTNYRVEEIYALVQAALTAGQQTVAVHVFPFPLTAANLDKYRDSPWLSFWRNLQEGYDFFERTGKVPEVRVAGGRYLIAGAARADLARPAGENYSLALSPEKSSR